jgi:hypothetical protein
MRPVGISQRLVAYARANNLQPPLILVYEVHWAEVETTKISIAARRFRCMMGLPTILPLKPYNRQGAGGDGVAY